MRFLNLKILITFLLISHTSHSFFAKDFKYKKKEVDALNAQIIRIDKNMDGYVQRSEYATLKAEGTIYGTAPNYSEVSTNGRVDYCQLVTRLGTDHFWRTRTIKDKKGVGDK